MASRLTTLALFTSQVWRAPSGRNPSSLKVNRLRAVGLIVFKMCFETIGHIFRTCSLKYSACSRPRA
ncbi:MAG: hypothetical protein Q7T03_03220, partial [Deltaproteobacteria bacterium]|nr:hypothetical protein [Deltaproteobacteria bacterium]